LQIAVPMPPTPPVTSAIFLSMVVILLVVRRAFQKKPQVWAWGSNLYPVMR
jgi:hypothetical protein